MDNFMESEERNWCNKKQTIFNNKALKREKILILCLFQILCKYFEAARF